MAQLTNSQLYELTRKYFGDLGADVVETMYQIALAESGGATDKIGTIAPGEHSLGPFQINVGEGGNEDLRGWDLQDPETNARAARIVYDRQGPTAWSTYQGTRTVGDQKKSSSIRTQLRAIEDNPPKLSDYQDKTVQTILGPRTMTAQEQFEDGWDQWKQDVKDLQEIVNGEIESEAGITRLEDGTIFHQADLDMLAQNDPAAYAQVQTFIQNRNIDRENKYRDILNSYDLSDFLTGREGVGLENSRLGQDFQNRLGSYRELIDLDKANQNTAIAQVERQLAGLSESRNRADVSLDALLKAAPWGTSNGKTDFLPGDFGSLGTAMAQLNGLPLDQPALRYTGVQNIDPAAMMAAYDQQLGVTGQLPQIPSLTTTASMIPQAPATTPIPQGSPVARRPIAPVADQVPQNLPPPPPAPPLDPVTASILDLMNDGTGYVDPRAMGL